MGTTSPDRFPDGFPDGSPDMTGTDLLLYGTSNCTLCERAQALVAPLAAAFGWTLLERDVANDDALFARYGERVPVLARPDLAQELDWPFDPVAVHALLARPRSSGQGGRQG